MIGTTVKKELKRWTRRRKTIEIVISQEQKESFGWNKRTCAIRTLFGWIWRKKKQTQTLHDGRNSDGQVYCRIWEKDC